MSAHSSLATMYFILTVVFAMILRVSWFIPSLTVFNPDWIALVLIYWCIALPERFGVFTAFSVGLLTDVLTGHLLGQYALIYALISHLSITEYRRLRQFPLPQQCLFVLFSLLFGQSLLFGMESMQAANRLPIEFWYPVLTGALAWPLVFLVLRTIRVLAQIS